jgi:peptidoglycan/LPS O-acetylase OafA/YrhL
VNRLAGLDAVRGFAALIVAVHHFQRIFGHVELPLSPNVSVFSFFVLSGFVMARTYEGRMGERLSTGSFLKLRYRRLFLPMAAGSTIGLLWASLVFGLTGPIVASYFAILLFLPAPWLRDAFILNVPAWSLFVEIFCNAVHPIFIAPAQRLAPAIVVCFALWTALAWFGLAKWQPGIGGVASFLPGGLGCYILGIYIHRRWGDRPLGRAWMAFAALFGATYLGWQYQHIEPLVVLVACPLILRCSQALKAQPWSFWIGALSFPLYAVHQPAMRLGRDLGLGPVWTAGLVAAISVALVVLLTTKKIPATPAQSPSPA